MALAAEELYAEQAKKRQGTRTDLRNIVADPPQCSPRERKSRCLVVLLTGCVPYGTKPVNIGP